MQIKNKEKRKLRQNKKTIGKEDREETEKKRLL